MQKSRRPLSITDVLTFDTQSLHRCTNYELTDNTDIPTPGSFDATVRLWDTKSQSHRPIQILDEARDSISDIAVHHHEIMTGSVDGRIRLYDLRMGMVYTDVMGAAITSLTQTADGAAVLASTLDDTIRLVDKRDGKVLKSYGGGGYRNLEYRIRSCLGLGDGVVVSGSEDGCLYAWDVVSGQVLERIEGVHRGKVASAVAWNGRRKEWASAGTDGQCCLPMWVVCDC